MSERPIRICILGGGFGGLYTALRLSELPWANSQSPEIILIDKSDRFVFTPLLYELISGELQTWEIAPPFEELFAGTGIRFQQGCITGVDTEAQEIHLEGQPTLNYDKLVMAIGGKTPLDIVPGARDFAIPFRTLADAYRLNERLRLLENPQPEKIRVAVVGGGYSGVELACKIADRLREVGRVRLIEKSDTILATSPEFNRKSAQSALEARKIWIDLETEVNEIRSDSIDLRYKGQVDTIPTDVVLWTVGTQVSPFVKNLPLKQNAGGRLLVTPYLQVIDHPNLYAIGDVADCRDADGQQVPGTAQTALQQADYCAWNLWASITNRPPLPFRYQPLGEMMALGVDNATLCGLGLKFDGQLAYIARRLIYLYRLPTLKHQFRVGLNWIAQPFVELLSR